MPTTIVVMVFGGRSPPQPDMVVVVPPGPVFTRLPKKAKEVLSDPVVLLILMFKVAVWVPSASQEQEPPVRNAPTIDRSFDVQRFASGQLNWANVCEATNTREATRQILSKFLINDSFKND